MGAGRLLNSYWARLTTYAIPAVIASAVGATFTWQTDDGWADANPIVAGPLMVAISLAPALLIVASARVGLLAVAAIAATAATGMVLMWWLFVSDSSSTSGLVFLWGWCIGMPLAGAVVAATNWRDSHRSGPPDPTAELSART
jgi:hypothetical protein